MAFTPGFVDVWEAGVSAERLPGVDYDTAIRRAITEGSNEWGDAVAAIEAAIWLRFGDPASARLEDLKQVARAIATNWPRICFGGIPLTGGTIRGAVRAPPGFTPTRALRLRRLCR